MTKTFVLSSWAEAWCKCDVMLFIRDCLHGSLPRPCPSLSRDTDTLHGPTLKPPCHTHVQHVNSAVCSGDSYKTENADDGKAKSRDTCATNCEAGTRERPANLFILALPCRCRHASLGFTYVSFSRWLLHTNPFSHFPT